MAIKVEILEITNATHDVKEFKLEKPKGYEFTPGQATEVAINLPDWMDAKRPFTFTSLPEQEHLEFVIKSYPEKKGVTDRMNRLRPGDQLLIENPWGAIQYKGKGVFIAGGAGITPFISIFRMLEEQGKVQGNSLFFANKTSKDVIKEAYFRGILGENFVSVLDQEEASGHEFGRIDLDFLKSHVSDFSQHFYVCGPDPMVKAISSHLKALGAEPEEIVFEK